MKNWAGNLDYAAASVERPASVEELSELVASAPRIKALGSRHCFTDVADTAGVQVLLDRLPGEVALDSDRGVVRVPAGLSYGELARSIERSGFALHNMASLPHISVAGAVQTGTHGWGVANPGLASAVTAIELVRASGEAERLEEADGEEFFASVVGLGALGIVTALELAVEPTYRVRQQVFESLPWETALASFDEVAGDGYSVSLFTDYVGDTIPQVWRKVRDDRGMAGDGGGPAPSSFHGAVPATRPRHPLPEMSAENCTEQLDVPGPWLDRLPHFRHEFTPSNGDELQTEYLLPRRHAADALRELRRLSPTLVPLLFVSEVRTVAADEFWLSPSYGQDRVALHFTWKPRQPEVEAVLPELEAALAPFGARPHWGKLFAADAVQLAAVYPRLRDFGDLAAKRDPEGTFRNAFLDRVLA